MKSIVGFLTITKEKGEQEGDEVWKSVDVPVYECDECGTLSCTAVLCSNCEWRRTIIGETKRRYDT